jgi:hypothetical protein
MICRKEDVEEKVESFWCDASYVADRNSVGLVRCWEIYLRLWYIKRESAFLAEHLEAVNFAFRKGFI